MLTNEALRVDVPVGFLLSEAREITVSVDRPSEAPLAIRLRLIPAESGGALVEPPMVTRSGRIARAKTIRAAAGYPDHDYGGGD
jgi:hypothetical protein